MGEGKFSSIGEVLFYYFGVDCRWYKDGVFLIFGGKYRFLSDVRSGLLVLEIRAVSKEDLGYYECEVRWVGIGGGGVGVVCFGDFIVVIIIYDL